MISAYRIIQVFSTSQKVIPVCFNDKSGNIAKLYFALDIMDRGGNILYFQPNSFDFTIEAASCILCQLHAVLI